MTSNKVDPASASKDPAIESAKPHANATAAGNAVIAGTNKNDLTPKPANNSNPLTLAPSAALACPNNNTTTITNKPKPKQVA
jgi:hypothetical protein